MRLLHQFVTDPNECTYLPDRQAKTEYSIVSSLSPLEYEDLMNRGFRKFGRVLFRPVCDACRECRPIRIPIGEFKPDRSQRRAWKRNQDLIVKSGKPTVDDARMDLYRRYHAAQTTRKGWPVSHVDTEEYIASFVLNPVPSLELSIWEGDALRGVILTEITPNVVSGVYHYHDPDFAERGLGTYCILGIVELARQMKKRWAYLGFFVTGCQSMTYKMNYKPCEIMDSNGVWRPA